MNITKLNWPAGWVPSDDPVNGSPLGLQRMDNLQQDEGGVLKLVRGLKKINSSSFSDYVSDIWSVTKNFPTAGNQEVLWAALNINGSSVYRSKTGDFSDKTLVCQGNSRAIFLNVLGETLIMAGWNQARVKDDTNTVNKLGLKIPGQPKVTAVNQPTLSLSNNGTWSTIEGDTPVNFGSSYQQNVNSSSLRGVALYTLANPVDTTNINGPSPDPDNDTFFFNIQFSDTNVFRSVKVDLILDNPQNPQNYFSYEWDLSGPQSTQFIQGQNANSILSARRGDFLSSRTHETERPGFTRSGNNTNLDWKTVTAIRFTVTAIQYTGFIVGNQKFAGGAQGVLNGEYSYVQVNFNNNGIYIAKSAGSPNTAPVGIINGYASVQLAGNGGDSQVNGAYLFRISVNNFNANVPNTILDNYYLVATSTPGASVTDNFSDIQALQQNITLNQFLTSIQDLQDFIYGMEGMFHDRVLYMGLSYLYASDSVNPDCIDSRLIFKPSGDPTEKNLWIKKVTNNTLILATTKDLYEVTGTFTIANDGTPDVTIIPLGERYPPLSNECASANGGVFYVASDGIRVTNGSNSTLVSPQLRLLFQGQTRAGHPPVAIQGNNNTRYGIAVGRTKLFIILPLQDGTSRLVIYDLINQNYREQYTDPFSIHVTPTDRVLLGYQSSTNPNILLGDIYQLDVGKGFQDSGGGLLGGQPIFFQSIYDCNDQPRNRKDTFTLKIICDTGGSAVNVFIDKDNSGNWVNLGQINCNGLTTNYFPLNNVTLGFRYAIRLTDVNLLTTFDLKEITIEYEPRPEQLDYLRIIPTNLGTISRKRVTAFAFVIDTLGNNITFTPYLDNVPWSVSGTINNPTKLTYIFYFTSEAITTDIGGILSGGVFEFYALNLEECVSEKLPTPVEYLIIPANNYGTPNRKRHTSYKFQLLSRGKRVQFTPVLDGVSHQPAVFNTSIKQTVEYFFPQSDGDVIGIDIGGILQSIENPPVPFEFYGVVVPQDVETLPPRLEYFRIPNNNFGVAARKRVRTLPMVIDTYGQNVTFTPIVDGLLQSSTTIFNTTGKTTVYHYFINDVFGTDFGGILQNASGPFEFYGLGTPEDVEVLPVPKKFDQLGPVRFDKIGKLFGFRVRLIMLGSTTSMPYAFYGDASSTITQNLTPQFTGSFNVLPNQDEIYEIQLPKNVNLSICRLVLGPTTDAFHRYDVQFKVQMSGMESDSQWLPVR